MRSISSAGIVDRSTPPVRAELSRTPSSSTTTWALLDPRIEISDGAPGPPKRRTVTPGVASSTSSMRLSSPA